jgi:hypothetical protein
MADSVDIAGRASGDFPQPKFRKGDTFSNHPARGRSNQKHCGNFYR